MEVHLCFLNARGRKGKQQARRPKKAAKRPGTGSHKRPVAAVAGQFSQIAQAVSSKGAGGKVS